MTAKRRTYIAASLSRRNTQGTVELLHTLQPWLDAAEVRLDLSPPIHLPHLLKASPLPLIITYRPKREGGAYQGSEAERLYTLEQAARLGAAAVDVEWDSANVLGNTYPALRIVSRHFFEAMPPSLEEEWQRLADMGADVVKLAAYAHTLTDALRMCHLFQSATRPTIIIAMGRAGVISRLIAPFFPTAFLTFGAANRLEAVAPGQLPVQDMHEKFHIHRLHPGTQLYGYLAPDALNAYRVVQQNRVWQEQGLDRVILPLQPTPEDDLEEVLSHLWHLGFVAVYVAAPLASQLSLSSQGAVLLDAGGTVRSLEGEHDEIR